SASQNAVADTGGATVNAYADNTLALDNQTGVLGAGQNVISYIARGFTVSSTGLYTISASALGSVFSNLTSGSIYAVPTQLTGQVQIFQTDSGRNTTTLLDSQTFSLSSLMSSSQLAALNLVSGDFYQMVVAISGVSSIGGQNSPPGIVTSYSNYSQMGFLGNLDGSLGAGTPSNPISLTATLSLGGIISTMAGTGTKGYSGDSGVATSAQLNLPGGVGADMSGNIYIADSLNNRIRKVDASTGIITTVAGNGTGGYSGDGGSALSAQLNNPAGVAVDLSGNLYIADTSNNRIREVSATTPRMIITVAGSGAPGYSGDGAAAVSAQLNSPLGVAVDTSGNLYIADSSNNCIREVNATSGIISTVAGNGTAGYSGDGGAATSAQLSQPGGVTVDYLDNIYIADTANERIRKVDPSGDITTVAGTGTAGYSGDGGPATSAELNQPVSVAVDASQNIYVADTQNSRIRKVDATSGNVRTIAGNGTQGYAGDGGPAILAQLNLPQGVAVDIAGDIYMADTANYRIRGIYQVLNGACGSSSGKVTSSAPTTGLCINGAPSAVSGAGPWTWSCAGEHGGTTASCLANPPAENGVCGSSNGGSFSSPPTSNLCSTGMASTVTGTGPWSWTCSGLFGGTSARCSADPPAVNGTCGSSNGGAFSSVPTTGLCGSGTASSVAGTGPWTWSCTGTYGGTSANCSANPPAVNGTCGSSNGGAFPSAPTLGLCGSGTASAVLGTGPWTWSCTGTYGGTTASCSANPQAINGTCGSSNGGTFTSAPTSNLCGSGAASSVSGTGPWSWSCVGTNGGTTASCSADPPTVDGTCGSSNGGTFTSAPTSNLCTSGTASTVSGSGPWSWSCAGTNGGKTANCSADPSAVDGTCGSSNGGAFNSAPTSNLCGSGTASAVSATWPWSWSCAGTNGGTTASCSAKNELWQNAYNYPTATGWHYLSPFGSFYSSSSAWIYETTLGWLYPDGTSTDSIWFYDPQWDGQGGWWWASSSSFPWVYSATEGEWFYYDQKDSTAGARKFISIGGEVSIH
ncbi:MAG: hypothetical protein ACP5IL_05465, partial [Syntrophobacteraceae bacterium]